MIRCRGYQRIHKLPTVEMSLETGILPYVGGGQALNWKVRPNMFCHLQ